MKVAVAPRALRDLEDIEYYTAKRWGDDQAARYTSLIRQTFERAAANPSRGRAISGTGGLFTLRTGSHVVAYRVDVRLDQVEIVRILHQAMDFAARLAAER